MTQYTHPLLPGFISPTPFTLDDIQYPRSWWRTVDADKIASMGFVEYVPPVPEPTPEPVPHVVSRRQIITGLAKAGWITEHEALEALAIGARPAAVEAVITSLPDEQQFDARMKWIGFTGAYRDDPLVLALAQAEGKSEQDIDEFFRLCAGIE